eukprot:25779_1
MFRRRKQWHPFGEFPTASVQRLPFQRGEDENKILYTTRYEPANAEKCGIFEYNLDTKENRAIQLWRDIDYYPRWDVSVYNETDDTIIFVGGANVRNHHHRYDLLVIYDLKDDTVSKYKIPLIVGGNARICLSQNDRYLHIIGGTSNDKHIMYDLRSKQHKLEYMYSFHEEYPQIQSCGFFYSSALHQLYVFGGRSSAERLSFDTFWTFDLNNHLSALSMRDASWLLINGWIVEQMYYNSNNYNVDYPVELNDIVLHFLGIGNTIHIWQKNERWRMPKAVYQFGYVMYKNRVIITFGGRDETNETIDDIFYLDLFNKSDGWKSSKLKCPKRSTYNAVLMEDDTVHIVPFYVHKDHFSIPIKKLLPSKLLDQISFDIHTHQDCSGNAAIEYKQIVKLRQRYFLNKVIISTLIGIIVAAAGLILYFIAQPHYVGIAVLTMGAMMMLVSLLCGKFYKPKQPEYLLY